MLKCQHCNTELSDEMLDSLDSEYVAHNYPSEDGIGQMTDYYCDPTCFVEVHDD